jgi:hypothetical protein
VQPFVLAAGQREAPVGLDVIEVRLAMGFEPRQGANISSAEAQVAAAADEGDDRHLRLALLFVLARALLLLAVASSILIRRGLGRASDGTA